MTNKIFKSIILLLVLISNLIGKSCNQEYIQTNKEFFYKAEKTKVFINPEIRWKDKIVNQSTKYLECYLEGKFLFMYLYREDLPNKLLIQFIFKEKNDGFPEFANNLVKREDFKQAIKNIKTTKEEITLEISTNNNLTIEYKIINGIIISSQVSIGYK